jgi:hypothetical protein
MYWNEVAWKLKAGVLPDGADRVRAAVRQLLPANRVFATGGRSDRFGPARTIGELDALDLGVQRAPYPRSAGKGHAEGPVVEPLPVYVERGHDEDLRARLSWARAGNAVLTLLVGGSCTGKTRAL